MIRTASQILAAIGDTEVGVKTRRVYPASRRRPRMIFGPCHFSTCDREAKVLVWCTRHSFKFYKYGHVLAGQGRVGKPRVNRYQATIGGC